jgi:tetratricopeptide (TPR) repeat protein
MEIELKFPYISPYDYYLTPLTDRNILGDPERKFRIFISYAREDEFNAKRLYKDLMNSNLPIEPWIDKENILPGQDWDTEIQKSIKTSDFFVPLFSSISVEKRGYVQREFKLAVDTLKDIPPGDIFVIPVRLDDCEIKYNELRKIQRQDLFPDWYDGLKNIIKSIDVSIEKINFIRNGSTINVDNPSYPSVLDTLKNINSEMIAKNDTKMSELILQRVSELTSLLNKIEKDGTRIEKIEASEVQVSRDEVLLKGTILIGNEYYFKGQYENAEQYYKKALEIDKNNIFCLINLNFLYAEKLNKFDESIKIMYKLLTIQPGLETKSNLIESLLKVGDYKEARKFALEIIKTPEDEHVIFKRDSPLLNVETLDYCGYQAISRFFIVCSYLLEGNVFGGRDTLIKFFNYLRNTKEDFKIEEKQWAFSGLIAKIHKSYVDYQSKFILYTLIDLLQGKIFIGNLSAIDYLSQDH